jgi:hypothetical protein
MRLVVVTVAASNCAFLFLYGHNANKVGFGVGDEDHGGGCNQQRHGQRETKWVRDIKKNQPSMGAV